MDLCLKEELRPSFCGRKVLITGVTGFIGSHLSDFMFSIGAMVYGISRSKPSNWKFPIYSVNLTDPLATQNIIEYIQPEIVFHLAGLVDARQDINLLHPTLHNNLNSSINLLTTLLNTNCAKVIIAGSSEEPDVNQSGGSPYSPYSASKAAVTAYSKMYHSIFGLPVVIVRPFMTYGPRQNHQKIIPYTISSLLNGIPPRVSNGWRICDLIYIEDLIYGLLKVGESDMLFGEIVELGTGIGTQIREVILLLSEMINPNIFPVFGAIPDRIGEYPQIANTEKARQLLNFKASWSLQEGLLATIEWYRAQSVEKE